MHIPTCIYVPVPVYEYSGLGREGRGGLHSGWVGISSQVHGSVGCQTMTPLGRICRQLFVSAIGCGLVIVLPLMNDPMPLYTLLGLFKCLACK